MTSDHSGGGRPARETWEQWQAPNASAPELLTRDELLKVLNEFGFDVSTSDLRFWEYRGVLPPPVRRKHAGAVRAVYPHWYPALVYLLRTMQNFGWKLEELAPLMRQQAERVSLSTNSANALFASMMGGFAGLLPFSPETLPEDLQIALLHQLHRLDERHQGRAWYAIVTLEDMHHQPLASYRFPLLGTPIVDGDEIPSES